MTQRDIETAALLYANEKFPPKIGTIGGGGHYAEVDLNEENCKQCYRHFLDGYSLSLERIGELEKEIERLRTLARNQFTRKHPKPYDDDPEFNQYVKNNNL